EQAADHLVDPLRVERQAVDRRGIQTIPRRGLDVADIGGEDLGRARLEGLGRALQPGVLGGTVDDGQGPRGTPGPFAQGPALGRDRPGFHFGFDVDQLALAHHTSFQPEIAVHVLMASTIAATSWTRTTFAPFRTAASAETTEAVVRWSTGRPVSVPRNDFR